MRFSFFSRLVKFEFVRLLLAINLDFWLPARFHTISITAVVQVIQLTRVGWQISVIRICNRICVFIIFLKYKYVNVILINSFLVFQISWATQFFPEIYPLWLGITDTQDNLNLVYYLAALLLRTERFSCKHSHYLLCMYCVCVECIPFLNVDF